MVHQQSTAAGQSTPLNGAVPAAWCPPVPGSSNWTLEPQHQHQHMHQQPLETPPTAPIEPGRKRKAESQDNERLSKRLSLLNLEQGGSKLYVPVETPSLVSNESDAGFAPAAASSCAAPSFDETMQLDDTKHKVYIYSLDDELASDDEGDDGKLVFLPDIDKHLRETRIPQHVLASPDGELAGMQMVLYSDPRSLTVPEDRDGVRRAIIDARHRVREKQRLDRLGLAAEAPVAEVGDASDVQAAPVIAQDYDGDAMDVD
ncbi:hypothetical protein HIM_03175 [Hirsutella minnesotensis 3608]|nr:hypothetical protein HIM_03175 [Hirsutella minnesotensis 3608]